MITARQIRAGRALLGWTQRELAEAASLSLACVNTIERKADVRAMAVAISVADGQPQPSRPKETRVSLFYAPEGF